jgi:hypothetical protein
METRNFDFIIREADGMGRGTPKAMVRIVAVKPFDETSTYIEVDRATAICHPKDNPSKAMFRKIVSGRLQALKTTKSILAKAASFPDKEVIKAKRRYNSLRDKKCTIETDKELVLPRIPSKLKLEEPLVAKEDSDDLVYHFYLCKSW